MLDTYSLSPSGIIIQVSSSHVWQQYAMGRLVAGLGVGALSANVPTYQAELAPKQIRGLIKPCSCFALFV